MSPAKLTTYCACHAKWPSNICQKFAENRWNVISNARPIRSGSETAPRMIRDRFRQSATRHATEVTFRAPDERFVLKNTTFRAPAIFPNFTKYCAYHEKWHLNFTKYCACHAKWHLNFTKYCACHEKWHLNFTKYCAYHAKWHLNFTKYFVPATKSDTGPSPSTAPATKDTGPSPSTAPATKSDTWASPNTAPATQNDSQAWSSSHMKRHLQCAEQQMSPSKLTKYCACHAKWWPNIWQKFAENSWNVISNARPIRAWSETVPRMIRDRSRQSATRRATEVTFRAQDEHFVLKNTTFRAPAIFPNFTKYCACHEKWHLTFTKYCTYHAKWHLNFTNYCAYHAKWHLTFTNYCACHTQQMSPAKLTTYCACHAKWPSNICQKFAENRWNVISNRRPIRSGSETAPRMIRDRFRQSATRHATEVTFRAPDERFVLKNTTFRAPAIFPNFTKYCAYHEKWHLNFTKYCAYHAKWHLNFTKYCACHEKWHLNFTKYCAYHAKWHLNFTKYCAYHAKWHLNFTKYCAYHAKWHLNFTKYCAYHAKWHLNFTNYCAYHAKRHWPSPTTAPATQNDSQAWSSSHMKRHFQCEEQQMSPAKLTTYCTCHAKWPSNICQKFAENRWNVRSDQDPRPLREWSETVSVSPQPATQQRLLFALRTSVLYWKIQHFALRLSFQISPSTAPTTKSDTWTSPSTAPTTQSDTWTSPSTAPATKSDTWTSPSTAPTTQSDTWTSPSTAPTTQSDTWTSPTTAPTTQRDTWPSPTTAPATQRDAAIVIVIDSTITQRF